METLISLHPKNSGREIDVEIEMEEYLDDSLSHIKGEIPVFKMRPKLDENNCLILKQAK